MSPDQCLQAVRTLWAGILELPLARVAADSHFLQLGGDSLHWVRMAMQLEQLSGKQVPLLLQVEWATPERCVAQWQGAAKPGANQAREEVPAELDCFPATPMQRGIWFAQQLAGDEALYAGAVLLHFRGTLDVARLQHALHGLYAELPLLRARFRLDTAASCLFVDCPQSVAGNCRTSLDLEQLRPEEVPAAVESWLLVREGCGSPPPFRVKLLQSGTSRFHLAVQLHHLICDGWSGNLLLTRLASAYNGEAAGDVDQAFARHAWRLANAKTGKERALSHWRRRLADFADAQQSLFTCPAETPWPYRIRSSSVTLPAVLRGACEHRARMRGVTPFVLCQAACKLALSRVQGESRQVLAIPRTLRRAREEHALGCFANLQLSASLVPERCDPDVFLLEEAQRFAEDCAATMPLDTLSRRLAPVRLPDGNPWSTVLLAFQNYPQRTLRWAGLECWLERVPARRSQYALSLEFMVAGDVWIVRIEYAEALFTSPWLDQFHSALLAAFEELAH